MAVYQLPDALLFPDPRRANPDGLLAVGGDLSQERLLLAYRLGIFPWYEEGYPILWWSPPRRCVMEPTGFHVSRSLKRLLGQERFTITFDRAFARVMRACGETRIAERKGTWITEDMIEAYCALHDAGYAHSTEAWLEGELVGGIYGVSLGSAFFGESMFKRIANASKAVFATLARRLAAWDFTMIDCQITNSHLQSLGSYEITRAEFLRRLAYALSKPTRVGSWS